MTPEPKYVAQTLGAFGAVNADPMLYGGKGAGLLLMSAAGLPVPEALVITTEAWKAYRQTGEVPHEVLSAVALFLDQYPDSMFSVRSGAPVSMPGMMDTVLNVGVTPALDAKYDGAFQRFATAWLGIVKGIGKDRIEDLMDRVSARSQGNATRFRALLHSIVQTSEMVSIPDSRFDQVAQCIEAVFKSWNTPRAKVYRAMHGISEDMGTACVVQRMVMGTAPGFSGSGVMFSRDPATGDGFIRGEFAHNAQGEEVVSGAVTPASIDALPAKRLMELVELADNLEKHFGDVQDIEFTYEDGKLYVLQTRTAKMSARARIITACSLAKSNFPGEPAQQLRYLQQRVKRGMIEQTMVPHVQTDEAAHATGLAASPGAISGKIVTRKTPLSQVHKGCILVAEDTAPEDFPIMAKAGAIFTKTGGFTCHSAVVARGIGVPAVVGCSDLTFTMKGIKVGAKFVSYGDTITLDGTTGKVWIGELPVKKAQPPREIYAALHDIVLAKGTEFPPEVYYLNCGLGSRVCLPLNPADLDRCDAQIARAHRLVAKGKQVSFAFELHGLNEDMFDSAEGLLEPLAKNYAPDLKDFVILYGLPQELKEFATKKLGMVVNLAPIQVLDLLDLLEG